MEELEAGEVKYESVGDFLVEIKKEFRGGNEESIKVAELKRIEQRSRMMEEFVQDFKRVARESGYKGHPLIKKFKWEMNGIIRRKLMETENQPCSIEQWFKREITLDRNWRESRREEERLRGKKENRVPALKLNNRETQRQVMPQLQVWQRRQEMPSQQVTIGLAPMEGVERTNTVMVRPQ